MRFLETRIPGVVIVEPEPIEDGRGFFARIFCNQEFQKHGLAGQVVQCSISFSKKRGTLRGMHYQEAPHEETKFVRCIAGLSYHVVADLRRSSKTFKKWLSVELSAATRRMLCVPKGFAHGAQSL